MNIFSFFKQSNDYPEKIKYINKLLNDINNLETFEHIFYFVFELYKENCIYETNNTIITIKDLHPLLVTFFNKFSTFEINEYKLLVTDIQDLKLDGYDEYEIFHISIGKYKNKACFVRHNELELYDLIDNPDMATPEYIKNNFFSTLTLEILMKKHQYLDFNNFTNEINEIFKSFKRI